VDVYENCGFDKVFTLETGVFYQEKYATKKERLTWGGGKVVRGDMDFGKRISFGSINKREICSGENE